MAETDVFSALNVGSGLNTSELIKNLVSLLVIHFFSEGGKKGGTLVPQNRQDSTSRPHLQPTISITPGKFSILFLLS